MIWLAILLGISIYAFFEISELIAQARRQREIEDRKNETENYNDREIPF